jgi:hypothetical protein
VKKTIATILFLCLVQFALSQTRVTGRIVDVADNSPIKFAQVAIFSVKDTSLVAGTTTAANGSFSIDRVRKGQYIFKATFMGYGTIEKIIEVTDESKPQSLGSIELTKGIELDAVEITEMLIPILIKGDTVEFNADAFRPVEGSPLIELLKRLPGFEVDKDGNITFQGKDVRHILVDGEEFFSSNPNVAAQNIPADFVQKVQTFERKSRQAQFTKIDDGNEETVVNLIFKSNMAKGWFGRLEAGGGADADGEFRYNTQFTMNYFRDKNQLSFVGNSNNVGDMLSAVTGGIGMSGGGGQGFMVDVDGNIRPGSPTAGGFVQSIAPGVNFVQRMSEKLFIAGSYRYSNSDQKTNRETFRENMLSDGTSQFDNDERNSCGLSNQHTFNTQIRYNSNDKNELIISPVLRFATRDNNAFTNFRTTDDTLAMINKGTRENVLKGSQLMASLQTEYRRRLNKPQRTISFTLNGSLSTSDNTVFNYSLNEFVGRPTDTIDQKVTNDNWHYNWGGSVIYTEPLINDFALELRYSIANNENRTERMTFDYNPFTQSHDREDSVFSNNFGNSFLNQHFTVRLQKNAEKYRYTLGFSLISNNNFSYIQGRSDIPQNALNIAPQADFRYTFYSQSSIELRYSGQTHQPTTDQLQAVPNNSNPLNIRVGNPELKPAFSHGIDISQRKSFSNMSSFFSRAWLNMTHNGIANITINDPSLFPSIQLDSGIYRPGMRLTMADNVNFTYRTGGSFSYSTPLFSRSVTLSTTTRGGLNNSKSVIDKDVNVLNNLSLSENLRITYRHRRFDVSLNGQFIVNNATYSLQPERNNVFYITSGGTDFTWQIVERKLVLSSDFRFSRMDGFSVDHNPRWNVWNAQLAWNIGKTNKSQLRLQVVDILNENNNTQRNVMPNYIEDVTTNIMKRYFLLIFTYNLSSAPRPM